jgi:hypothetical protein
VAPNILGFLVLNLFHVILLASRILKCILDFWKICAFPGLESFSLHL